MRGLALALALTGGISACSGQSQSYKDGYQIGYGTEQQVGLGDLASCTALVNEDGGGFNTDCPNDNPHQYNAGFFAGCQAAGGH